MNVKARIEMGRAGCPAGEVRKAGYYRKGYRRKDGVRVKAGRVPSTCIPRRGATPAERREAGYEKWSKKIPGLGVLRLGPSPMLGRKEFIPGWEAKDPASERRAALKKDVKREGCLTVSRKLVVVRNLNHRTNPGVANKAMADRGHIVDQDWCKLKKKRK